MIIQLLYDVYTSNPSMPWWSCGTGAPPARRSRPRGPAAPRRGSAAGAWPRAAAGGRGRSRRRNGRGGMRTGDGGAKAGNSWGNHIKMMIIIYYYQI